MKLQSWLVTGATGMIGQALVKALVDTGHGVRTLGRSARSVHGSTPFVWSPSRGEFPLEALEGVDVVVHLAAASVGQRWTGSHRRAILESRTLGTHLLREALIQKGFSGTWIQASAIGIYGHAPSFATSNPPKAKASSRRSQRRGSVHRCRRTAYRFAWSDAPRVGAVARRGTMLPIYKFGLGAPLGSGQQHMGWVHLDDVIQFIRWAAATPEVSGVYNVVAPRANTNVEFSQSLAKALNRPHWAPKVPGFALSLAMGEMSALLLEGQNVRPSRLLEGRFQWRHPDLLGALQHAS